MEHATGSGYEIPEESQPPLEEVSIRPTVPAHQGRDGWRTELSALLTEARARGDERPANELINEWLQFRKDFEGHEE